MDYLNKFYDLRINIPRFIKYLMPKFLRRKISKKFFPYYFLITDYKKLPLLNYINNNNLYKQKNLIEKFNINQYQTSFMTCPYLHQLLLTKYNRNDNFSFLDIGGENIDFFLQLKKNFKNVKYNVFNLEKINDDYNKLKFDFKYQNLNVILKINDIFNNKFDFVNFGSCIQYFDNYENILENITENNSQIFFSGTTLFESRSKNYEKHVIVKQVNMLPQINYCYFFNKNFFYNFFYKKNFNLIFESKNLTDNVNFKNFRILFEKIQYYDFFFKKN
jgi:hypothetical protein